MGLRKPLQVCSMAYHVLPFAIGFLDPSTTEPRILICSGFHLNKKSILHIGFFSKRLLIMHQLMHKYAPSQLVFLDKQVMTVP